MTGIFSIIIFSEQVFGVENNIPTWIKNNAKWWSEGKVSDSEFLNAMEYLIDQNVITVRNHSVSKTDSVIPPSVTTDKRIYQMGEEIEITGSGFEYGTVGVVVGDDRFNLFLDKSQNIFSGTAVSELGDMMKYPISDPMIEDGQWKKMNFTTYGSILKTNVKVNSLGTWQITLETSDLANGHYEIRVGEKIYNGFDQLSNSSQTFLLKTAKTDFFIGSS